MEGKSARDSDPSDTSPGSIPQTQLTVIPKSIPRRGLPWKKKISSYRRSSENGIEDNNNTEYGGGTVNHRANMDVEQVSISIPTDKSGVATSAIITTVRQVNDHHHEESLPRLTKSVTQEKSGQSSFPLKFLAKIHTSKETVDVAQLPRELKRAKAEVAEKQLEFEKLAAEKKLSEDALQKINLNLQDEIESLKKQFSNATQVEFHDAPQIQDNSHEEAQEQQQIDLQRACNEVERLIQKNSELSEALDSFHLKNEALTAQLAVIGQAQVSMERQQQKDEYLVQQELEELRATKRKLEEQNTQLRADLQDQRTKHGDMSRTAHSSEELSTLLAQAQKDKNEAISQRNRVVQQLASQATKPDDFFFDDNYFQQKFCNLRQSIKEWAFRTFPNKPSKSAAKVSEPVHNALGAVNSSYLTYLESSEHRPSFVQAYVWRYLGLHVFGGKIWEPSASAQPYGRILKEYHLPRDSDAGNQILYHNWRCAGARFAAPKGTEKQTIEDVGKPRINRISDSVWKVLEVWSTMDKSQSSARFQEFHRIVTEAVTLDLEMQQQKAYFALWGSLEFLRNNNGIYDRTTMDVRFGKVSSSNRSQYLRLLHAPLLAKWGRSDGKDYSTCVVLEKAVVDLEIPSSGRR